MKRIFLGAFMLAGLSTFAQAQTFSSSSPALGTSGSWLVLPSSVRAESLAEAYVGVADDVGSMTINPAGIGQLRDPQINLMHNSWVQGVIEEQVRGNFSMDGGVMALGLGYLNEGTVDRVTIVGGSPVANGNFQPNAWRLDMAYAKELLKDWYFGASGTVEEDSLDSDSRWGAIGNLGALAKWGDGIRAGLSLVNIGGTAGYATPAEWRFGGSYETDMSDGHGHILISTEAGTLFSDFGIGNLSFGAEYLYDKTVAVRAGQQFGAYGGLTGLTGFSVGAGVKVEKWELDYSFVTRGDLGTSNLLSFNYHFEGEGKSSPTSTPTALATAVVIPSLSTPVATPVQTVEAAANTIVVSVTATETILPSPSPATVEATSVTTVAVSTTVPSISTALGQWWDEPFDAMTAFEKLKSQMVPDLMGKGQMGVLGKDAAAFFSQAKKDGATPEALSAMRCGYYTAIASQLFDQGRVKDAAYYLKIAMSSQKDNPDALALKAKIDQVGTGK